MDFGILAIAFRKMVSRQKKAKKERNGRDYKTDKGRKWSFMGDIFISCCIAVPLKSKIDL